MSERSISPEQAQSLFEENAIHVWTVALADWLPLRSELSQTLDPTELERAARFRFERDQKSFTVYRGLLRTLLGTYLQRGPKDIKFEYGPQEKPQLAAPNPPQLEFNLSHSHGYALYAFAAGRRVGVDIEQIREGTDTEGIGRHVFTPDERQKLSATPPHQKEQLFFDLWTLKEAYIKAVGLGLSAPVREIAVAEGMIPKGREPGISVLEGYGASWSLLALRAPEGFKAAVAAEGEIHRARIRQELLEPKQ